MRLLRIHGVALTLLLCGVLQPALLLAQTAALSESGVAAETLESRIQEVEVSSEFDEVNRALLLDLYRKSLSFVNQRQTYEASTQEYIQQREQAPKQSARLDVEVAQLEALPPPQLEGELRSESLAVLDQKFQSAKARLSGLRASLTEASALLEARALRGQQVRERLEQARARQTEISQLIKLPNPEDLLPRLAEARLWSLQLETRSLAAEIEMLNQELLSQPMRIELYTAQRAKALLEWNRQQERVALIGELVGKRRLSDAQSAQQEAEEVERQSFGKHPLVQELAQGNTRLSSELNELAALVEEVSADEAVIVDQVKRFATSFRLARQKLEIAGLSQALGEAMLQQRKNLPRSQDFNSAEKHREKLVIESSLRQIRNQQERAQLSDIEGYIDSLTNPLSASWQSWIRAEINDLAMQRRDLLDKAIAADDSLLQALSELDFAQRELSKVVSDYNQFLDERLLWVRTGDLPTWQSLALVKVSLNAFFAPDNWAALWDALLNIKTFPWIPLLGLLLFLLLMQKSSAMHASLRRSGRKVGQLRHDRFHHSIRALLLTLALALPWPVLFISLGLHLQFSPGLNAIDLESHLYQVADWSGQFVPSVGVALYDIALYLFYFIAFRLFCYRGGLAVRHFHWPLRSTELLRRETLRLMVVFLPSVFLLIVTINFDPAAIAGGFSRLLFCVIVLSLAYFFGKTLSINNGALRDFYRDNSGNILTWLRHLWLAIGLLLPLVLAALAIIGYVYTAVQLGGRLIDTLWLVVAIILIHQLVVRWVVLLERQLEFRNMLERHRAQRAARDAQEESEASPVELAEEHEIDFSALSEDTKKLINSALAVVAVFGGWAIWSEVLPAFRILDDVSLWSYSSSVDGVTQRIPVTLGNLITGLLIIVFGAITARRLPALMEITLFTRLNVTAGSRYAISKLTQYSIIAIGMVMFFSVLGGSWGEIQWLVAALGVGIGFGLQEIIANFISGLILLFERPIRIGDIVTVGDTSGVVTKIRIRSTTIRNWDQQELLVPNKEFITGRLLNWTLSDPMARIVISVGVAYGSNVEKAIRIVTSCAEQHERVLEDPPPLVTFESFGDNALEIKMRCYIDSMDFRLLTMSELNQAINRKMEAAGIVIAFPQRDIHLDTSQPLDVHLHRITEGPKES